MFRPMLVAGCVIVAAAGLLSGCKDELAPSRVQVLASAEPAEVEAEPMTGVNVGNSMCRYVILLSAYGAPMSEFEWLDSREIFHNAVGTDTLQFSADDMKSFFSSFNHPTPFQDSMEWGLGGPTDLLPITIDHVFHYRRKGDARTDSTTYHVVCR